jgi:mitochondrial fission protein ELM1
VNQLSQDFGAAQSTRPTPVWLLLGTRRGDTNQLYALARELGLPFEDKTLTYNRLRHLPFLRGAGLLMLTRESRRLIAPPWPRLVIGVGYASVWVARAIRRLSGGRTRIVQVGNPRTGVDDLDLVITTPQYWRPDAPNVLALPYPMGNPATSATVSEEESRWLDDYPRPCRLVAIGGPARNWRLDHKALAEAIATLAAQASVDGGSIIAVTSPRTSRRTAAMLENLLTGPRQALVSSFPRFPALLGDADEIYVTADSVSMLTEAILTGKPVGMIPIGRSTRGRVNRWLHHHGFGGAPVPDFPRFWRALALDNLVGPVSAAMASQAKDSVTTAARAVRELLRE